MFEGREARRASPVLWRAAQASHGCCSVTGDVRDGMEVPRKVLRWIVWFGRSEMERLRVGEDGEIGRRDFIDGAIFVCGVF